MHRSESTGDLDDHFNRNRPSLPPPSSFRRQNLSLNIGSLPVPFENVHLSSPTSLASSGAPYTDSFALPNAHLGQDYFQFDEASLPSATDSSFDFPQQVPSQYGYRLPASQPSSPVRSIYPSGQGPYVIGRQRGATFSGSFSPYGEAFGGPLYTFSQPPILASAVPSHLFLNTQSPLPSPLNVSPLISASPTQLTGDNGYFGEIPQTSLNGGLGMGDVLMDDVSTPTPLAPPLISRRLSHQDTLTPETGEMKDKLSVLDA